MITGYYGKDGVMSEGWETEEEAQKEFKEFYENDERFAGCFVTEYNDEWVIAYE